MTDKQIKIDDYFRQIFDKNSKIVDYEIKNSDVLKLVQKIENLKDKVQYMEEYIKTVENERNDFEQECEKLKKEIKRNGFGFFNIEMSDQLDQLKQTLTEIKEIAEIEVKHAPDGETFARPEIKQILQKISEVENEN